MSKKRPTYFRFFLEACDMIALLDEERAGRVIYAVGDYFAERETVTGQPCGDSTATIPYLTVPRAILPNSNKGKSMVK